MTLQSMALQISSEAMNFDQADENERAIALLAWEAACERLRVTLKPPEGYPSSSPADINSAFENAAERLHVLRSASAAFGDLGATPGGPFSTEKNVS